MSRGLCIWVYVVRRAKLKSNLELFSDIKTYKKWEFTTSKRSFGIWYNVPWKASKTLLPRLKFIQQEVNCHAKAQIPSIPDACVGLRMPTQETGCQVRSLVIQNSHKKLTRNGKKNSLTFSTMYCEKREQKEPSRGSIGTTTRMGFTTVLAAIRSYSVQPPNTSQGPGGQAFVNQFQIVSYQLAWMQALAWCEMKSFARVAVVTLGMSFQTVLSRLGCDTAWTPFR